MSETRIRNLNLSVTDLWAISILQLESARHQEFFISINFKDLISLKFLDDTVLIIQFENGELRLDLSRDDLEGI
ncbi:MAG: hypothetical protein ACFFD4_09945 [Candidatus Odinarchaeota archaeon]